MYNLYPLLIVGGIIGAISIIFVVAFCMMKDKKTAIGFDRNMKDSEIIKRLLVYAKPHIKSFILVFVIIIASIVYDIASPIIIGNVTEMLKGDFELPKLYTTVITYASILVEYPRSSFLLSLSTLLSAVFLIREYSLVMDSEDLPESCW